MSTTSPYRLERDHNRTVVTLLPGLNDVPWADIEQIGGEIVQRLREIAAPALLVDLCALNYMGSVQVALVVRMFKAVKEGGGRFVVANSDPMVQQVLTLAGLDKLWTMTDSREAGLSLLGGGASEGAAGNWQCAIGVAAVAVSLVGLFAVTTQATWLSAKTALIIELVAAAVAFVFALWAVLKGIGSRRAIGACVLVGSVALMLVSVYRVSSLDSSPPQDLASPADPSLGTSAPPVTALSEDAAFDTGETATDEGASVTVPEPVSPPEAPADAANPIAP